METIKPRGKKHYIRNDVHQTWDFLTHYEKNTEQVLWNWKHFCFERVNCCNLTILRCTHLNQNRHWLKQNLFVGSKEKTLRKYGLILNKKGCNDGKMQFCSLIFVFFVTINQEWMLWKCFLSSAKERNTKKIDESFSEEKKAHTENWQMEKFLEMTKCMLALFF